MLRRLPRGLISLVPGLAIGVAACGADAETSESFTMSGESFTSDRMTDSGSDTVGSGATVTTGSDDVPGTDGGSGECPAMTLGCPCGPNQGCANGLVCADDLCVGSGVCGNEVIEQAEQCDDGNTENGDGCESDCTETSGATEIVAGNDHTCVRVWSGEVHCWGSGSAGRLGYGSEENIGDDEPASAGGVVDVGGRVLQLSAGQAHTCALLEGGTVRCWGQGADGQLGYGNLESIGDDELPREAGDIDVGGTVVQISAGGAHTCARLQGGALRCWGNGALGRLGYGNEDDIGDDEAPAIAGDVPVGAAVTFVGAGSGHTCAVLESGGVRCWGFGFGGRLGQGNLDDIGDDETPASVATVPLPGRFLDMSLGAHSCVRDAVGDVYCWGGNLYGQLGLGHTDDIGDDEPPSMAPVLVGDAVVAMSSGGDHNCVVTKAGTVRCWGRGEDGRLGYLATSNVGDDELPTATGDVSVGGIALGIAGGFRHSCAILDTGAVRCWGSNGSGQLGYGKPDSIGDDEMPAAAGDVPFLD